MQELPYLLLELFCFLPLNRDFVYFLRNGNGTHVITYESVARLPYFSTFVRVFKERIAYESRGLPVNGFILLMSDYMVWDSVVGKATCFGLDGLGIDFRWGARFSAPVQTGPGAQPASSTMGTGSCSGVKRQGVTLTTHPIWRRGSRAKPLFPLWSFVACSRVNFVLPLPVRLFVCSVVITHFLCVYTIANCRRAALISR